MKLRNLMWGACACILATGCSNDDVAVNGNENGIPVGGDSYVAIQLVAANGSSSRATNGEFNNGHDDEGQVEITTVNDSKVAAADFYFYKGDKFVKKGEVISDLKLTEGGATDNIESSSNVMVVLKNVTDTPDKVLVVLNGKDVKLANTTLSGDLNTLVTSYSYLVTTGEGAGAQTTQYFLMSNSSYLDGSTPVCATPIEMRHLQSSEELAIKNPVEIYVERVAAKVQLKKDDNFKAEIEDEASVDDKSTKLTIEVNGWGLSGTNKNAYCMKKISSNWSYTGWSTGVNEPQGSWNDLTNHRSYWAQDDDYMSNEGKYPENYDGWTTNGGGTSSDQNSLNYLSYNDLVGDDGLDYDDVAYCFENTMDYNVAYNSTTSEVNQPAVTHLLIAATLKVSGESTAKDLFRYQGEFFTKDNYIAAALNVWKAGGNIIYRVAEEGETEGSTTIGGTSYISVTTSDVEIVNKHDGKVSIQLTTAAKAKSWYTITGTGDSAEATEITTDKETILAGLFDAINYADGFKEGKMYYCVPIEHLNDSETVGVGSYGVVRNHFYQLTLKSIKNIGTAVYDPTEVIIPNYEPETYWVAARLNILSWKIVNQSVNL